MGDYSQIARAIERWFTKVTKSKLAVVVKETATPKDYRARQNTSKAGGWGNGRISPRKKIGKVHLYAYCACSHPQSSPSKMIIVAGFTLD